MVSLQMLLKNEWLGVRSCLLSDFENEYYIQQMHRPDSMDTYVTFSAHK